LNFELWVQGLLSYSLSLPVMKLALFASLATLALASPAAKRADYPDCEIGTWTKTSSQDGRALTCSILWFLGVKEFYYPDTVTIGEAFPVKYCTSTYFKTSSNTTFFGIGRNDTTEIGNLAVLAVKDAYTDGYEFDLTIPYSGSYGFAENSYFHIVELINDYYIVSTS
jgi:hypothetical protein